VTGEALVGVMCGDQTTSVLTQSTFHNIVMDRCSVSGVAMFEEVLGFTLETLVAFGSESHTTRGVVRDALSISIGVEALETSPTDLRLTVKNFAGRVVE
jgi:hypothetical protein